MHETIQVTTIRGATIPVTLTLAALHVRMTAEISGSAGGIEYVTDLGSDKATANSTVGAAALKSGARYLAAAYNREHKRLWIGLDAEQGAVLVQAIDRATAALAHRDAAMDAAGWDRAEAVCPAGHVACKVRWTNGDLMASGVVTRDGLELTTHDTAAGEGNFVWVPVADVERAREQADTAAARRREETTRLQAVEVPGRALRNFRRYGGDDARAWETNDEGAAMDIKTFGDAIEAQGLGSRPRPRPDTLDQATEI